MKILSLLEPETRMMLLRIKKLIAYFVKSDASMIQSSHVINDLAHTP